MPRTRENIQRHELIGLKAEVKSSPDRSQENISGEVMDETQNTLDIDGKKVPKQGRTFLIHLENEKVEVKGEDILERPEDRT
jgi:ribonuclease P protein subunit POP4